MAGSVDDERLVEQFKGHDESAFERIVKLQVLNTQLRQTESQLALATTFDLRVSQLRLIREAIETAERRIGELTARIAGLALPVVMVLGAD